MGKTLLKLAVGLLVATVGTASFLVGLNIDKFKVNPQNAQNTSYVSESNLNKPVKRETKKNLEDYFVQDREIGNITRYSTDTPNPVIANVKDLSEEDRQAYESNKILRVGLGEYVLSGTENSSEKNLSLSLLEFESSQARREFLEKNKDELSYPVFVKDNVVSLIEKVTPKGTNPQGPFSEEQQTQYLNFISDYAAKRGMEIISSGKQIEQMNMYETNSNSASENANASNTQGTTNEPGNIITEGGLESLFLGGKELGNISLVSTEDEQRLTGLSLEILTKSDLFPHYNLINRSILNGNPYIANQEDMAEKKRGGSLWDMTGYGEAVYFIPTGKEERQTTGNTAFIKFSVYQFDSRANAEEAIYRMEGYTDRIDELVLKKDKDMIVIDAKNQIDTPMQATSYLKGVLNYEARTGAKISAKDEDGERALEEKLRKAYEAFSRFNGNTDSLNNLLESFFESTEQIRRVKVQQSAVNEQFYSDLKKLYAEQNQ